MLRGLVLGAEERPYVWGDAPPSATLLNACGSECAPPLEDTMSFRTPTHGEDDGWPGTAPVGSFPDGRSRWGHLDVAGNVFEWVELDAGGPEPGGQPAKASAWGGSWYDYSDRPGVNGGGWLLPQNTQSPMVGFRCARTLGRRDRGS